jgi:hypothetical protein
MKSIKSLLSQNLTWTFSKKKIILKSNDETMLELQEEKSTRATFALDGKNYIIRNKGFWNAITIIEKDGKQMLSLKRNFLRSKGSIEFDNGNLYSFRITNSPLAKLSFFNKDEKEILYYKVESTPKPKTVLSIIDNSLNEKELLMLIILGCYSFKGIVSEHDDTTFLVLTAGA